MKLRITLFLVLITYACKNDLVRDVPFPLPSISSRYPKTEKSFDPDLGKLLFPIYYIGPLKDSIEIASGLPPAPPPPIPRISEEGDTTYLLPEDDREAYPLDGPYFYLYGFNYPEVGDGPYEQKLSIFIDTTHTFRDVYNFSSSYPVYIINNTDSAIILPSDLLWLAVDKKSERGWSTYILPRGHSCGTGVPICRLPPQEIIITGIPRIKGTKPMKIRLRWASTSIDSSFTSNEIWVDN